MDPTKAFFKRIKGRNRASFQLLAERYGWKLYCRIRRRSEDRETADRIFSDTFTTFYNAMESCTTDDPIEALLNLCAEKAWEGEHTCENQEMGQWEIGHEMNFSLPEVHTDFKKIKKEPLGLRIFYGLCVAILILGIGAALWILLWMLMSMNLIPHFDLGYSWFNAHIFHVF